MLNAHDGVHGAEDEHNQPNIFPPERTQVCSFTLMSTVQTLIAPADAVLKLNSSQETYRFQHLIPSFSKEEHYPPLEPFEHADPGHRALTHNDPLAYLQSASSVSEITPAFGTEVRGVKLDQLDSDARDELALHVAQRGVVIFRDQDGFIGSSPEKYLEWGRHFGR